MWWNEITSLKRQVKELQGELEKEQGKASRLTGFMARLQTFGISPAGNAPKREFAEALLDSVHMLLKVDQAALLEADPATMDLTPLATRGMTPQVISQLRIRPGEGVLGRAAQSAKILFETRTHGDGAGDILTAPYMIVPIVAQGRTIGLLVAGKPQSGGFAPDDRALMSLFAGQAALLLEDHASYEGMLRARKETVATLVRAIEARDPCTYRHLERTRHLVRLLCEELSLPEVLIGQIEDGAMLHDVGKIGIADGILQKPSELTPEEFAVMKTHAAIGRQILEPFPALRGSAAIVLYHQEWYNGSGYPEGLAGEEIPLGARVVQVVDAWDAMTSDRPYWKAMPKASAIAELRRQAGTQFDPKIVDLFLRLLDRLEREGVPTTELQKQKPLAAHRA